VLSAGTTPPGTTDEKEAGRWVQDMFGEIAPKYDLLNHLLSFNIDRGWRKVLLKRLAVVLANPDARILDLCCGTGDVLLDLQSAAKSRVMGADFCHPMLVTAKQKAIAKGFQAPLMEGDAMELPLAGATLDAITIAFGFRNLVNYSAALTEFLRVLKPGGTLAILEFSHPPGLFMRIAYGFYSRVVLPAVGALISGSREAYTYLPESVSKFPKAEALQEMMADAGFNDARFELLTGGVTALHTAQKS
jgi:demethylmenaquinone methyltransferase/2-methoxy-6-polyprenyl-1,4-benzoquinol methylase